MRSVSWSNDGPSWLHLPSPAVPPQKRVFRRAPTPTSVSSKGRALASVLARQDGADGGGFRVTRRRSGSSVQLAARGAEDFGLEIAEANLDLCLAQLRFD